MERQPRATQRALEFWRIVIQRLKYRLLVIFTLMLAPWLWVTAGMFYLQDFRWTVLLYAGICCLLPTVFLRRKPIKLFPLQYPIPRLALLTGLCAAIMLGGWFLMEPYLLDWPHFAERLAGIGLVPKLYFWPFAAYFVLFNPVIEELFWRGFVLQELKEHFPLRWAIIISSVAFGGWHWLLIHHFFQPVWTLVITVLIMLGGIIMAVMYEESETLAAPILLHGLGADLPILIVLYDSILKTQGFQ